MKWLGVLACLGLVLWVSAGCALAAAAQWPALAAHLAIGATCVAVWAYARYRRSEQRLRGVVGLVRLGYREGADVLALDELELVLDDEAVTMAAREARRIRDQVWAARYARGEQSDC